MTAVSSWDKPISFYSLNIFSVISPVLTLHRPLFSECSVSLALALAKVAVLRLQWAMMVLLASGNYFCLYYKNGHVTFQHDIHYCCDG